MRVGLTGDVMLGRLVDEFILADPQATPAVVWGDTLPLFAAVDARLVNLECVIATTGLPDLRKVFRFRARPRAIDALRAAGVDFAGLANNHTLDYGPAALAECLDLLRASGVACAGAGRSIGEASAPAVVEARGRRLAVVAITDNEPESAAGAQAPGVNFVAYDADGLLPPHRERLQAALAAARSAAEFVVVCAHIGPNWGAPSAAMQALAHQLIDLGADLYWGHSNHSVQAVEFRGGRAILYSTGDFLDDYAVDPDERNDLSFFVEVEAGEGTPQVVRLHPVRIEHLSVHRAAGADARWLRRRMEVLCAPFGTRVDAEGDALLVAPG